jgi:hypothetical protein
MTENGVHIIYALIGEVVAFRSLLARPLLDAVALDRR